MTTSSTTVFNLNMADLIEEAFERCGHQIRTGYEFRTAARSVNLLTIEWANRGINLWTVEQGQIPMVSGQALYPLPDDTIDLMDMVIRTNNASTSNQIDINITRISETMYLQIPNKTTQGRPIQVWINRLSGQTNSQTGNVAYPTITVWPTPDNSTTYTFAYTRLRRMQDAGTGINAEDVPFRMWPPLISGLAYYLSMKIPGAAERTALLKSMYDEDWMRASDEDREKAPVRFVPRETFLR